MIAALLATVCVASFFRAPAEFEPQQSVWMSWPTYDHKKGVCVHEVQLEVIKALMRETKVEMLVHSRQDFEFVRDVMDVMEIPKDKAGLHQIQNRQIWIRDFGPQFVMNEFGDLAIADFNFNFWSYAGVNDASSQVEESVDRQLATRLKLPVLRSSMISEGGNREVNGRGTMLVVESVERQRNPGMTRAEMQAEYRRLLGVTNVIWLKKGVFENDFAADGPLPGEIYNPAATGGHVNNVARFSDANTILLAEVTGTEAKRGPIYAESRRRLEENFRILRAAKDQDGRPFRIIRVPCPDLMIDTMEAGDQVFDVMRTLKYRNGKALPKKAKVSLAGSYLNFLVSNGTVVCSKFGDSYPKNIKKDKAVESIFKRAFPGRKVVMVDTVAVNLGGGGIHSITQTMPRSTW